MVIKTLNTENPFADFGGIVEGERFVGRSNAINAIHSRVLGTSYGNIAIMGHTTGHFCKWDDSAVKK